MEHRIKVDEKDHALDGQNRMNSFRKEKKHCDFIIKVESEEIPVHRAVICSRSDYFDAMFSHDTKEKRTGVAEIKEVDVECTVKCVDFMYTGETSIKEDKCGDLMHVATLFQLLTLCNAIAAFLEEKLDCKSFFTTKQLADLYNCQKLVDACNDFALKHFQDIAQMEEFKQLDLDFVKFIVGSQDAKMPGAEKCKAAIEWIKQDAMNRKFALLGFLEMLDLTKIPLSYRGFLTEHEPLVSSSLECMKMLATSVLKTTNVTPADVMFGSSNFTLQGIAVFDLKLQSLQFWDIVTKTWTRKQSLKTDMNDDYLTAIVLDDHLYVFTGRGKAYRIAHSDPDAEWEPVENKNLKSGPAVALNGSIYTSEWGHYSRKLERYDPNSNKWSLLPDKKHEFAHEALACAEGNIFCIGGQNEYARACTEVEVFNPITSSWSSDSPLKKARNRSSATTFQDGIYVLGGRIDGGFRCFRDVEYRCPRSKTWTVIPAMNTPRQEFSSCCINGKIFAVAGDASNPKTIEEYDPETKQWAVIGKIDGKSLLSLASIALPM